MSSFEKKYKKLLLQCLREGDDCINRTGVNTFKLFNKSFNINLNKGFPIVTGIRNSSRSPKTTVKGVYSSSNKKNLTTIVK